MSRVTLKAPIAGWLTSVREVPDPVFSEEMMGVGLAIDPTEGTLVAPCDAEVLLVAPSQHSVTLKTETGAELLIHIGLETVGLAGKGFEAHVRDGDRVSAGDQLISFDLDTVGLEAKSLVTPIVLTNAGEFRLSAEPLDRLIERGQLIASIEGGEQGSVENSTDASAAVTRQVVIAFEHGLHARPAARIADAAKRYSSEVTISLAGKSANARSPIAIMALNVRHGDGVQLSAAGADAEAALDAIVAVLDAGEVEQRPAVAKAPGRIVAKNEIGGVCALPGVVLGTAMHWRRQVKKVAEEGRGVSEERSALEQARTAVRERLEALSASMDGPAATIAQAHIGLLDDEQLNAAAAAEIEAGRSAARAWQAATGSAAEALRSSGNPLLRERIADLDDITAQVTAALSGDASSGIELPEGTILLADELLPSELMWLRRDRVAGLATSGGGPTSHMAIIAASFGIPTLVAMGPRLAEVSDGTRVLLDSTAGVLVIDPDEHAQARAAAHGEQSSHRGDCVTRDGERISLLANLGSLRDADAALAAGAEGCGLLRTEFLFLDRLEAPSAEEQRGVYQSIADALGDRPLTIRTIDIGGDKPVPYIRFPDEQNPALGARGIRTDLFKPELLEEQLRAIAQVTGKHIKAMLPMVSSVDELRGVRARLDELGKRVMLGVMVETPAAALIADRLAAEADFLSIGSNDLAQYTLAMDRTNPLLAASIDSLHPAVLRLIVMTAAAGQKAGKAVSLCGSLASEPLGALLLVGFGIRELSAVPAALPAVRSALARVSAADCRRVAEHSLKLETAAEVRALAAELMNAPVQGGAR
ncbi:multiphosphoryl transfer protein [Sphingomonas sp. F9_3S_D5_B_2]